MQTAKQLDGNKFPTVCVDIEGYKNLGKLQAQVKREISHLEDQEINMLFIITDAMQPKDVEQNLVDEKKINDREKFKIILQTVSDQTGVSLEKIKAHRRFRESLVPRWVVIFLTRWATTLTMEEIARAIVNGVRLDHTSIWYACAKISEMISVMDENFFPTFQKIIYALHREGIHVNLKSEQPIWYKNMIKKYEQQTLVTG